MRRALLLFVLGLAGGVDRACAADWPQFRGPNSEAIASDKGLSVEWSLDSNIAWKTELPGPGTSSPIVVGNKVFLTCYSGYGVDKKNPGDLKDLVRHVLCIDRTAGKILWKREIPTVQPEEKWQNFLDLHGYASSTPCSDGNRLFVFLGKSGVFAFDLDGKQLWQVSVGTGTHGWGSATSPLSYKDLLIVNASVESGSLIALDKTTGKEQWRAKGISESWSSPILVKVPGGGTELVVSASQKILGYDPDSGKELWHADSYNWYVCPTLVAHKGVVYGLQNDTCVAVKAGGRGDVTGKNTLWQTTFGSTVSSPVYHDGHLYFAAGQAYCLKADDGSVVYKQGLKPNPDRLYASPVVADGKLYYVSRTQGTFVLKAGPKFELLARNTLDDSVFNGSPAVSNSQLLLRSDRYLYCIGKER
jgi:outer membrane protein assembly factor BamB